jgi:hypothetical protein
MKAPLETLPRQRGRFPQNDKTLIIIGNRGIVTIVNPGKIR